MIFKVEKIENKNNGLMLTLTREERTQEFLVKKNTKFYQDWGEILIESKFINHQLENVIIYATVNYSSQKITKIDAINLNTNTSLWEQVHSFIARTDEWLEDLKCCGYNLQKIEMIKQALIDFGI